MAATTLAAALVEAQREVKPVAKDATNSFHKYKYSSSEAVYGEARRALTGAGLAASLVSTEVHLMSLPGDAYQEMLRCRFVLVHAASADRLESTHEIPILIEKGRPFDKALMGARTTALAYYLRDLLLMQRGDFDEVDSRADGTSEEQWADAGLAAGRPPARADDPPPHVLALRDIAAATTLAQLTVIAGKIAKSDITGAYLDAIRGEWTARKAALAPAKAAT